AFAFGVFGDAPYTFDEVERFNRLIEDVNASQLRLFLHIGDIIGVPCSDELLADRRATLGSLAAAVLYTPGDNEWADCGREDSGGYESLERLEQIRRTYFSAPRQSLGARPLPVETQSDSAGWSEFVENARLRLGRFLFTTIHVVGSGNGAPRFGGDTARRLAEVQRRTAAALHWIDAAFAEARRDSLHGIVIAMHADPGFNDSTWSWPAYRELVQRLVKQSSDFTGQVLFIHGDSHVYRVDHPLRHAESKAPLANFTRLETYGSPSIGWVRVVIDSVAGRVLSYEPRLMPNHWW
ncbi:MAG: hypothetical protein AB1762_15975, partial [Gemmatimonadota bacterium]